MMSLKRKKREIVATDFSRYDECHMKEDKSALCWSDVSLYKKKNDYLEKTLKKRGDEKGALRPELNKSMFILRMTHAFD